MKIIVGLGNPGEKYDKTRHNLGFVIVDHFFKAFEPVNKDNWRSEKKFKSQIAEITWQPKEGKAEKVILAKPDTFMNNSGLAVGLLRTFYKVVAEDIWIVHDELDLPLGNMKIRKGGSGAGHKGIESVIEELGTPDFWRFRMGIGETRNHEELGKHRMHDVEDYVLGKFDHTDAGKVREMIQRGVKALECALEDGMESAMNRFNSK